MDALRDSSAGPGICPGADILYRLQAGLLNETSAGLVMEHITQCRFCGIALKVLMGDPSEALSEEDQVLVSHLVSSQPEGRRKLARRMARQGRKWSRPMLLAAGIMLALAGVGAWYALRPARLATPQTLLARAYSTARPFEYRLSGLPHGPLLETRSQTSAAAKSPELAEALDSLEQSLAKAPGNPELLAAEGRAELLARDLAAAEAPLRKAHEMLPSDPRIAADLAVLWAYRSQATGDPEPLKQSLALTEEILRQYPGETATRFNRALLLMRLNRNSEAAAEFQQCLSQERDPAWAAEIAERLRELTQAP